MNPNFLYKATTTVYAEGIPWTEELLKQNSTALSCNLINVFHTWLRYFKDNFDSANLDEHQLTERRREQGKILKTFYSIQNDIHNLAVLIDMLEKESKIKIKRWLYLDVLVENYITNVRSIYDFIAIIIRVTLSDKQKIDLKTDVDTLSFLQKRFKKNSQLLDERIIEVIMKYDSDFQFIRKIRDSIVHKGDNLNITFDEDIPKLIVYEIDENSTEKHFIEQQIDLMGFLKDITKNMFYFLNDLGDVIYNILAERKNEQIPITYTAFQGVCIPNFIKFLK